jgi:hypothetical protein
MKVDRQIDHWKMIHYCQVVHYLLVHYHQVLTVNTFIVHNRHLTEFSTRLHSEK